MTQALESMRRRIESAEDLYAVVRVMKTHAAASIRQCERAVESLVEYNRTIEAGLQIVLRSRPDAIPARSPVGSHWANIVFGSDQGMCGSFNEQVVSFVLEQFEDPTRSRQDCSMLVVGSRVAGRLEDAGCAVDARFAMPSTVSGITTAVSDVLLKIEEMRSQDGARQFLLVHHRPNAPAGSSPQKLQLLPIDRAWLASLAMKNWESRALPMYTMDWRRLFSALIRQYLFIALYRAFAESMASENASRLASMHAAEKNIRNHLSFLAVDYHEGRQQAITEELLDIVAGFETLMSGEDRRE